MRLFVAIDLPEQSKLRLAEIQRELSGFLLRFVDPSILHLTLKFLGNVPSDRLQELKSAISGIKYPKFKAHLRGLGAFPSLKNPRVIWVGFHSQDIYNFHQILEQKLSPLGFDRDPKFHPHVTLARSKGIYEYKLIKKLSELEDIDLGSVDVDSFKLKRSILTTKGPIYEDLLVRQLG